MLRILSYTVEKGADIGECLNTGYRIKEGDDESWYKEWLKTAQFTEKIGEKSLNDGHKVSARETYLHASNYYRIAEFFIHQDVEDPRILEFSSKSNKCFQKAGELFQPKFEFIEIPYENTSLPAYVIKANNSIQPKPTIIIHRDLMEQEKNYISV